jgi:PAS domain S-box-containing protein/putative nucleotidyltransferase with HDIG domain
MDKTLLQSPGVQVYDAVIVSTSGERRDVVAHKATLTKTDGTINGIVGVAFDVTERKQLEKKNQGNAAMLAAADAAVHTIEAIDDGIILFDLTGLINSVNPAFMELCGYEGQELVNKNILEIGPKLFKASGLDIKNDILLDVLKGTAVPRQVVTLFSREGIEYKVILTLSFIKPVQGQINMVVATIKDITGLLGAQTQIKEGEQRFRGLFENSKDAVVITSRNGDYVDMNNAFVQLLGATSKEELITRYKVPDFYYDPADRTKVINELERVGYTKDFEIRMKKKNGQVIDTVHTISVRRDAAGNMLGYQGIIRDMTDKNRMEAALREAEQNQMLVSITSFVSSLEARDSYTRGHSDAVSHIIWQMAKVIGLEKRDMEMAIIGGKLHDIGKIGIRDSILLKPGKLSDEEFDQIKKHPLIGAKLLSSIPSLAGIIDIVLSHHERFDGKGYPNKLQGKAIPLWARMTAVADTYHALTSNRPYRPGMPKGQALQIIADVRGTQLCPESVDVFMQWIGSQAEPTF